LVSSLSGIVVAPRTAVSSSIRLSEAALVENGDGDDDDLLGHGDVTDAGRGVGRRRPELRRQQQLRQPVGARVALNSDQFLIFDLRNSLLRVTKPIGLD
jgi:hypothetical protein